MGSKWWVLLGDILAAQYPKANVPLYRPGPAGRSDTRWRESPGPAGLVRVQVVVSFRSSPTWSRFTNVRRSSLPPWWSTRSRLSQSVAVMIFLPVSRLLQGRSGTGHTGIVPSSDGRCAVGQPRRSSASRWTVSVISSWRRRVGLPIAYDGRSPAILMMRMGFDVLPSVSLAALLQPTTSVFRAAPGRGRCRLSLRRRCRI